MLKLFDIHSTVRVVNAQPIVTKKEKVRNSSVNDPRPMKKNIPKHNQSLTKELIADMRQEIAAQSKLVFDFGLILEQCLTHYSGLLYSITLRQP